MSCGSWWSQVALLISILGGMVVVVAAHWEGGQHGAVTRCTSWEVTKHAGISRGATGAEDIQHYKGSGLSNASHSCRPESLRIQGISCLCTDVFPVQALHDKPLQWSYKQLLIWFGKLAQRFLLLIKSVSFFTCWTLSPVKPWHWRNEQQTQQIIYRYQTPSFRGTWHKQTPLAGAICCLPLWIHLWRQMKRDFLEAPGVPGVWEQRAGSEIQPS